MRQKLIQFVGSFGFQFIIKWSNYHLEDGTIEKAGLHMLVSSSKHGSALASRAVSAWTGAPGRGHGCSGIKSI